MDENLCEMTDMMYRKLQERLKRKLKNNSYNGNKREIYQNGIMSAMSIIKEVYEFHAEKEGENK